MDRARAAAMALGAAGLATAGIAALSRAAAPSAAAELSAAEIVARSVAARGGLEAWRKVETMVWTGHVESAHTPSPVMPFTLAQKRPNKTRLQIEAPGLGSVRVFDGLRGWKVPPGRGEAEALPYAPPELRSAQAAHGIDGPLVDCAARGSPVALEGVDALGSRKAYHLKVTSAKGAAEDVWVDTETFLEVRYDRMADGPAGAPRRVSASYDDYRAVDGLRIPFLVQTGGGPGVTPDRMRIERVALNVPLDDAIFGNPAAPRPRPPSGPRLADRAPPPPARSLAPIAATTARGGTPR